MKNLLQVIGWASVAAGLIMCLVFFQANFARWIALSWIFSGIISGSLFFGVAHAIGILERLEAHLTPGQPRRGGKATYLPGWDPNEQ